MTVDPVSLATAQETAAEHATRGPRHGQSEVSGEGVEAPVLLPLGTGVFFWVAAIETS